MVDGLLRSSAASKNLGISLNETISLLTVMRETSGRTGREVGNALNSILSYITRGKTLDVLESSGIQVFTDSTKTQFRNFMDVIRDISTQWNKLSTDVQNGFISSADEAGLFNEELADTLGLQKEWSDVQKRDVSNAAAGVYRRNYFLGLVQGFEKTTEVMNDLNDAQGYTLSELDKKLQTLDARFKILINTLKEVAVNLGNDGALAFAKTLVDMATGLVKVIDKVGIFNIALITLGGILGSKFGLILPRITIAIDKMVTSMGVASGAATTLSTALSGILVIGGILLAVKAFDILYTSVSEQKIVVEELTTKYNNLNDEIKKLQALKNPSESQQLQLKLLERELVLQQDLLKTEKERLLQKEVFGKGVFGDGEEGNINESLRRIKNYYSLIEEYKNDISNGVNVEWSEERLGEVYKDLTVFENKLLQSRKIIQDYIDSLGEDAPKALLTLKDNIDSALPNLQKMNGSLQDNKKSLENVSNSSQQVIFNTEKYAKTVEDANKVTDEFQSNGKNIASLYETINDGEKLSANNLLDLIQNYPTLTSEILNANSSKEAGIKLTEALFEIEKTRAIQKLEDNKKILESEISILEATAANMTGSTGWANSLPKEAQLSIFGGSDYSDKKAQLDGIGKSIEYLRGLKLPNYSPKKETTSKDPYKDSAESYVNDLQYLRDKDKISEAEYYNQLEKLNNKYFANKKKYLDDYRKYEVEVYNGRKKLAEESFDKELDSWKSMFDDGKLNIDEYIKKVQEKLKSKNLNKDQKEELNNLLKDLKVDKTTKFFDDFSNSISQLEFELDGLDYKYKLLGENEYSEKIKILTEEMNKQKEIASSYDAQIDYLNQNYKQLGLSTEEYNKKLQEYIRKSQDANVASDSFADAIENVGETAKQRANDLINSYQNYILDNIEKEIDALEKSKKQSEETAQTKIDGYQKIIDALQEQNKALEEEEERTKRLKSIEEARQKVSNIQVERNTKVFKDGKWTYEANQKDLANANKELQDLQEDYNQFELDNQRKHQIDYWNIRIKAVQEQLRLDEKAYDDRIASLNTFINTEKEKLEGLNNDTFTSFDQLQIKLGEMDNSLYSERLGKLTAFVSEYNRIISTMNSPNLAPIVTTQIPATIQSYLNNPNVPEYAKESMRKQYGIASLDTGGDTGKWGTSNGKLAVLHQDEIILNSDRTKLLDNILQSMPDAMKLLKQIKIESIFGSIPKMNFPTLSPALANGNGGEITNYNLSNFTVVANNPKELITQLQNLSANR